MVPYIAPEQTLITLVPMVPTSVPQVIAVVTPEMGIPMLVISTARRTGKIRKTRKARK